MRRKWDVSSEQVRKKCLEEIITRIEQQEESPFGILAAEEVLGIVLQNVGQDIYNLAIKDVKKLLQERFADLEVDLDLLRPQS